MNILDPKFLSRWAFAGGMSLLGHAVFISLFVWIGSAGNAQTPTDPADANATVVNDAAPTDPAAKDPVAEPPANPASSPERPKDRPRATQPTARPARPGATTRANPPSTTNAETTPSSADAPKTKNYRVKKGDNLTHIARDCGSTPAELAKLNGVSEKVLANLKVGQVIKIKATEE